MPECKKPCLHCGEPTSQRAEGVPYCSMDCIGAERRKRRVESYQCPYPGCEWEDDYLPGNGLSEAAFNHAVEQHHREHKGEAA